MITQIGLAIIVVCVAYSPFRLMRQVTKDFVAKFLISASSAPVPCPPAPLSRVDRVTRMKKTSLA